MSIEKNGFRVGCESCHSLTCDDSDSFDIAVPVTDLETGVEGSATLRCHVNARSHDVSLVSWQDATLSAIETTESMRQRLSSALQFFGDYRICGNKRICPTDVVRIVEKHTGGS